MFFSVSFICFQNSFLIRVLDGRSFVWIVSDIFAKFCGHGTVGPPKKGQRILDMAPVFLCRYIWLIFRRIESEHGYKLNVYAGSFPTGGASR